MKIQAALIIEMMGRPAEHIKNTMEMLLGKMAEEKGVKILNKKIHEPKQIENKELFTSFAEIEVEVENIIGLMRLVFGYMPSHMEIISPEKIDMTNMDLNDFFNEATLRLHKYDEIAKKIIIEKQILERKLNELMEKSSTISTNQLEEIKKDKIRKNKKSQKKAIKKKKK